jgi:Ca2+:H+ antiporter
MTSPLRLASLLIPILGWLILALSAGGIDSTLLTGLVLVGVVIAAVHHAETVAYRVGEPFGTLILAVAVTVIEVGLIVSLMLANREAASTLARDTVFAAGMIIMNLLLGLCLIAAAKHQKENRFTRTGATAALATLATLMVLTLILPSYTTSVTGPIYSPVQLAFVAAFSLLLYLTFVFVQTMGNREYFLPKGDLRVQPNAHAEPPTDREAWISFAASLRVSVLSCCWRSRSPPHWKLLSQQPMLPARLWASPSPRLCCCPKVSPP